MVLVHTPLVITQTTAEADRDDTHGPAAEVSRPASGRRSSITNCYTAPTLLYHQPFTARNSLGGTKDRKRERKRKREREREKEKHTCACEAGRSTSGVGALSLLGDQYIPPVTLENGMSREYDFLRTTYLTRVFAASSSQLKVFLALKLVPSWKWHGLVFWIIGNPCHYRSSVPTIAITID